MMCGCARPATVKEFVCPKCKSIRRTLSDRKTNRCGYCNEVMVKK